MLKMSVSMDGFCADSDPHGPQKWLFDTADDESNAWEISFLKDVGYHAMGHDTYRVMAGFWPVSRAVRKPGRSQTPESRRINVVRKSSAIWTSLLRTATTRHLGTDAHLRQASANGSAAASARVPPPGLLGLDQSTAASRH
jgi:hypothetical protein